MKPLPKQCAHVYVTVRICSASGKTWTRAEQDFPAEVNQLFASELAEKIVQAAEKVIPPSS